MLELLISIMLSLGINAEAVDTNVTSIQDEIQKTQIDKGLQTEDSQLKSVVVSDDVDPKQ